MERFTFEFEHDRGQTLVLFALAAMVLFAFAALAIDGGMAYAQRRTAQNAADSASVAGTYQLRYERRESPGPPSATVILEKVHEAAEAHGIPDTNGIAGDAINDNVFAYLTDADGDLIGITGGGVPGQPSNYCRIQNCPQGVLDEGWGVLVYARKPFDTFFAGILGVDQMTMSGRAKAVTHTGTRAADERFWAVFSIDEPAIGCSAYEGSLSGSTSKIRGNTHSNGSFWHDPSSPAVENGQLTAVVSCDGDCRSSPLPPASGTVPYHGIELPEFDDYRQLAWAETGAGGSSPGGRITGDVTLTDNAILGSLLQPFTYITGNLHVPGDDVIMTGLIFVDGNVLLDGARTGHRFSIFTTGKITIGPNASDMRGAPYNNATWDILTTYQNPTRFYSNLQYAGNQACTDAVIDFKGAANGSVLGAFIAPNGLIRVDGQANLINGTLIGNTVQVAGTANRIVYNHSFFPPQPDWIEMTE